MVPRRGKRARARGDHRVKAPVTCGNSSLSLPLEDTRRPSAPRTAPRPDSRLSAVKVTPGSASEPARHGTAPVCSVSTSKEPIRASKHADSFTKKTRAESSVVTPGRPSRTQCQRVYREQNVRVSRARRRQTPPSRFPPPPPLLLRRVS